MGVSSAVSACLTSRMSLVRTLDRPFKLSLFMQNGSGLKISATAVAELNRQAAFTGTPGVMHIDLLDDKSERGGNSSELGRGKMMVFHWQDLKGLLCMLVKIKFYFFKVSR